MLGEHTITLENNRVGTARVTRQGLYYLLECRCQFPDFETYRVNVVWKNKETDLGICVQNENGKGLRTRMPIKSAGEGPPVFRATAVIANPLETFIPLDITKPSTCLSLLRRARLKKRDGEIGIVVTDPV